MERRLEKKTDINDRQKGFVDVTCAESYYIAAWKFGVQL